MTEENLMPTRINTPEADGIRHRFGLSVPATVKTALAAAGWT